jgi:autotransporter-associated beta strand protein
MKPRILSAARLSLALASALAALLSIAPAASATTLTWDANAATAGQTDGGGAWIGTGTNLWWDGANNVDWTTGGDAIFGNGGTGGAVTLASPTTVNSLTFNSFTGTYTLGTAGQAITLNTGLIKNSSGSGAVTIISPVTLGGAQSWLNNSAGLLTIGTGAVDNGGFLLTIGGSGNATVSSVIGGAGGLTKTGAGQLTLSGANSFAGSLSIENGRVFTSSINNKSANGVLGAGNTVVLGASGQTGRLAIQVDGGVSSNKDFTLATGGTGEIQFGNLGGFSMTNADRPLTLSGIISGSGNLVKLGGSALVLSGNNTYSGTTTVNEGQLRLGSANALPGGIGATGGTSALTINGNGSSNVGAVVELASGNFLRGLGTGVDQFQIPGGISGFSANGGARQVIVGNDASLELQWGAATFNPSTLLLNYQTTGNNVLTLQNKIDLGGATRTIEVRNNTATLSGDIRTTSGTAGITKIGAGTLALSGANTYNGPTTISVGTLTIGSTSTFNNTSQIVLSGASRLEVNAANASLTKLVTGGGVPAGTFLRYSQAQTTAGPANGPGTILGTVELNVTNVNPDYTLDFGGNLSKLTNLVAATYNSPVTLSGNPSIDSSTAVFTGGTGMTVGASTAGAKTLFLTGSNTGANTLGGVIGNGSGTLTVTKTGGGAWTLTGTNTYSGATTVSAGTLTLGGANGSIGSSAVTTTGGTLTVSNTGAANNGDRLSDSLAFTMNGGTFNFNNDASNNAFSESAGTLALVGGANTVAIQQAGAGGTSTLTFAGLSRTGGAINFSGAGLGTAVDPRGKITFTSAPALTDGIIGPWATVNGSSYATLSGNDVVAYSGVMTDVTRQSSGTKVIPDSATADVRIIEGTGGSPANLTLAATTTTIDTLLHSTSGGTGAVTVDIASGQTLRVNSVNSVPTAGALTLGTAANTGTLMPATAGGNLLLINSSTASNVANANNNLTVNSVVADNTSASTVTKDGAGVLRLTATNTYSGGTVINAGTLAVKANANLGATGTGITFNGPAALSFGNHPATGALTVDLGTRPITINNSAVIGLHHNWADTTITIGGAVTGTGGGLNWGRDPVLDYSGSSGSVVLNLNSTGNTFTGPITVGMGTENAQGGNSQFNFSSLGDSTSPITFNFNGGTVYFSYNASGPTANLSLANRPINLLNSNTNFRNQNATYTLTLGAVSTSTLGAKTLNLGNGGAGGIIAGAITNGVGTINVDKTGSGTWALGGTNTYSGTTAIRGGAMTFQGSQSVSPNSPTVVISESTARFLDDGTGTVSIPNTLVQRSTQNGGAYSMTIFVGNNSTANGGTSGGTTTGSTIAFPSFIFDDEERGRADNGTINITGANGYRLQLGGMSLGWRLSDGGTPSIATLNPTTAPLTISGTVIQRSGNTTGQAQTLTLGGTATGNLISGTIMDAADFPSNTNARALNVTKSNSSEWTLSGNNTYTGTTTVSAGTLLINGNQSAATGAVAVNGTSTLGGSGTLGGTVTVAAGANLAPGNSAGTLTIGGGLNISAQAGGTGKLKFELGPIAASDKIAVTGTLTIGSGVLAFNDFQFTDLGGLQNGTYKLITSGAAVSGTLAGSGLSGTIGAGPATGALQITGNDLELVVSGVPGGSAYEIWSGFAPFNADANGDGVTNGLAWMLGAANKDADATGLLPEVSKNGTGLVMTFDCLSAANRGTAVLNLQHSGDIGITDAWAAALVPGTEPLTTTVSGVDFVTTANGSLIHVVATIPSSGNAMAGKLFGRLKASETP